ncbi:MAG: hypothetical protein A2X87_01685 [Deltaproteobacteria bacterium GWC2_42_51]|nr:MAG: hypothetical protein A2067_05900 [Deltaproteobacteria bacterium GWB2_42_7]OGP37236.1 MAG: hypothetical protein A2X87_01685 [Deltaproteobacteria bacterium GWC2_42_51]OGP39382.1 MAG: hypothetical protein A2090_10610 [Deltaproteobacteria bacterium GWD2_42_10]OGP47545.1 MAG: hypothetical protein A2022_09100 [Deltaproteobacteria bacterium GWF2_42_12]OGQ24882.1 MAG: hypothetical protein A3D29_00510 [Deltaproteobacteria bacterium RIFCSPHIGHO2_02_FULL_42_44]OGQ37832.1 MAG: hypothetical protein
MAELPSLARFLIIAGLFLIALGVLLSLGVNFKWLGRLPGDIYIKRDNFTFYFPLTTSIVISIILTLLFYIFRK